MLQQVQVMSQLCLSIIQMNAEVELHTLYFLLLNGNKSFKTILLWDNSTAHNIYEKLYIVNLVFKKL
jgi:hypothetical protein